MVAWATMFLMAEPGRILFDYSTAPRKNDRKSSSNTTVVINVKILSPWKMKAKIETATRITGVAINVSNPIAMIACPRQVPIPRKTSLIVCGNSACGDVRSVN